MKNLYNVHFESGIVSMQCWDTTKKEFVTVLFDLADLKKIDAATNNKWWVSQTSPSNPTNYVQASGGGKKWYLHRLINNTPTGLETHHLNGDGLDNRKSNLKSITTKQHRFLDKCRGESSRSWSKTGRRGVRTLPNGKFQAFYSDNIIGNFDTVDAAQTCARQYREWIGYIRQCQFNGIVAQ